MAKGKKAFPHDGGNNARTTKGKKAMKVIIAHDQSWLIECTSLPSIVEHP